MYYIDTTVLVAYYCPEAMSEQVQSFLGEQLKPAVSELTEVELCFPQSRGKCGWETSTSWTAIVSCRNSCLI